MGRHHWYRMQRRTQGRVIARDIRSRPDINIRGDYAAYLVRHLGRPMERALIKSRQTYEAQKPVKVRTRALHRAYRARRR
jgi:hypothetical protein